MYARLILFQTVIERNILRKNVLYLFQSTISLVKNWNLIVPRRFRKGNFTHWLKDLKSRGLTTTTGTV